MTEGEGGMEGETEGERVRATMRVQLVSLPLLIKALIPS